MHRYDRPRPYHRGGSPVRTWEPAAAAASSADPPRVPWVKIRGFPSERPSARVWKPADCFCEHCFVLTRHTTEEHYCGKCKKRGHARHHHACTLCDGPHKTINHSCSKCGVAGHDLQYHACGVCRSMEHETAKHTCEVCQTTGHGRMHHCQFCSEIHPISQHPCSTCGGSGHKADDPHCSTCKSHDHDAASHKCTDCGGAGHESQCPCTKAIALMIKAQTQTIADQKSEIEMLKSLIATQVARLEEVKARLDRHSL